MTDTARQRLKDAIFRAVEKDQDMSLWSGGDAELWKEICAMFERKGFAAGFAAGRSGASFDIYAAEEDEITKPIEVPRWLVNDAAE